MVRLAIIRRKKPLEKRLDFPFRQKMKTMDRVAKTQEQKFVETMARFSI